MVEAMGQEMLSLIYTSILISVKFVRFIIQLLYQIIYAHYESAFMFFLN